MHYMWADTLQSVERAHLLRVLVWGAASILAGTALLAWIRTGARQSALLRHFAYQCAGWGCAEAALAAVQLGQLAPRDLSSATRFDRVLWLSIGLDGGFVLTGLVLAIAAWRLARALGGVGAGIGIVMQGLALAVLDLLLAAQISR